ncbi:MAG: carbamoyltransferase HypF [Deltaproteobacteria bacterium]|nr:carbamoyltransferase HypF [Deltaproteobacteria bacterium]
MDRLALKQDRKQIKVTGLVQGVGFRPTVYRYAVTHRLAGFVKNTSQGVLIDVTGTPKAVKAFVKKIQKHPPALARIDSLATRTLKPAGHKCFKITRSRTALHTEALITPDTAVCPDCLREFNNPKERRYQYPLINCTNCGPRYTITTGRPYDRPQTTMKPFVMCDECAREYLDPADRRFHAEPNSCFVCGPVHDSVESGPRFHKKHRHKTARERFISAFHTLCKKIGRGQIVAVKGLGGYHLAVDPFNRKAVLRLRKKKRRMNRAFALMAGDINVIKNYAHCSRSEQRALISKERPIVLLTKKDKRLDHISPDNNKLGCMLPATPLQHLFANKFELLVMTSANLSGEPLMSDERDLKKLFDHHVIAAALTHNRKIANKCDDSILQVIDGKPALIRRARGYVPDPISVKKKLKPVLALGANLKNTFALGSGHKVFLSPHMGDLTDVRNMEHFKKQVALFLQLFAIKPKTIVTDAHPDYENTRFAEERLYNKRVMPVYHHYAHMVSCIVDNGLDISDDILGIICDGTGFGTDGHIWGCEFLKTHRSTHRFKRLGHLKYFKLPGGEQAIAEPYRIATALFGDSGHKNDSRIKKLLASKIPIPQTSSLGRVFDGVAACLKLIDKVEYEAQAAILLESEVYKKYTDDQIAGCDLTYPRTITLKDKMYIIDLGLMFDEIKRDKNKTDTPTIALKFHKTIIRTLFETAQKIGFNKVVLSGGCFQNRILLSGLSRLFGKKCHVHKQVPANDAGISLGQAYLGGL